jgi:hypothetical protein
MSDVITLPVRKKRVSLDNRARYFCMGCNVQSDRFILAADGEVYCAACGNKQKNLFVSER